MGRTLALAGKALNALLSFPVFVFLDLFDFVLCFVYKLIDFSVEWEWKPCYCSSPASPASGVYHAGGGKQVAGKNVLRLCDATNKLQLDTISDTLRSRPHVLSNVLSKIAGIRENPRAPAIVEIPNRKPKSRRNRASPRWSDCNCKTCSSWIDGGGGGGGGPLYVRVEGNLTGAEEDVLFIHGFISSSAFWTETVFPMFSGETRSMYRLLAVDLLGFGRSPKPEDSLYTMNEQVEMIERWVLDRYRVRRVHIVAHSLGSVLALAVAARHPAVIASLTLLAPPYFQEKEGEKRSEKVMRSVAPRRIWPPMAFAASMACWYEHISRTICLLICRQHRLWDYIFKTLTLNRIQSFLIEVFMCHTHTAAWHTLHNIICGGMEQVDTCIDTIRKHVNCHVSIFHGQDDEVVPVECSYAVGSKLPGSHVKIVDGKDHITLLVGRQKAFAAELEQIWKDSKAQNTKIMSR